MDAARARQAHGEQRRALGLMKAANRNLAAALDEDTLAETIVGPDRIEDAVDLVRAAAAGHPSQIRVTVTALPPPRPQNGVKGAPHDHVRPRPVPVRP